MSPLLLTLLVLLHSFLLVLIYRSLHISFTLTPFPSVSFNAVLPSPLSLALLLTNFFLASQFTSASSFFAPFPHLLFSSLLSHYSLILLFAVIPKLFTEISLIFSHSVLSSGLPSWLFCFTLDLVSYPSHGLIFCPLTSYIFWPTTHFDPHTYFASLHILNMHIFDPLHI